VVHGLAVELNKRMYGHDFDWALGHDEVDLLGPWA
jgi:hypothetical protein